MVVDFVESDVEARVEWVMAEQQGDQIGRSYATSAQICERRGLGVSGVIKVMQL